MITRSVRNNIELVHLENDLLRLTAVPAMGGKILELFNKKLSREFLWTNGQIPFTTHPSGTEYDPNFIGGFDELLPNDIPENIDGIDYPDHGELWTTQLHDETNDHQLILRGRLSKSGLYYQKIIRLGEDQPSAHIRYQIRNITDEPRHFLWKLHAALRIQPGDRMRSSARKAQVVDPAYSRFPDHTHVFDWPHIAESDASLVPPANQTMDFFYLWDSREGVMEMESAGDHLFRITYDQTVFPYEWYFASFGGFLDHYTAILEPCTNMPLSVNDAITANQSAILAPGASLQTSIRIFAGSKSDLSHE